MRVLRITSNLPVADIDAAKRFYTDFLGLSTEEFKPGLGHPAIPTPTPVHTCNW
jgi:catechol 2,3-dioxygenase-like lactoylglutathione lyase family enzyme